TLAGRLQFNIIRRKRDITRIFRWMAQKFIGYAGHTPLGCFPGSDGGKKMSATENDVSKGSVSPPAWDAREVWLKQIHEPRKARASMSVAVKSEVVVKKKRRSKSLQLFARRTVTP